MAPPPAPEQPASTALTPQEERIARLREREKSGRFKAFVDTLPLLATLATAAVAVLGNMQSQQQYRDTQASERFQSAVEMLAGDDLTTRVGGIALLGQVAQTSSERRETAVRLLATYLRVHLPVTDQGRAQPVTLNPPAEEVRAVFTALAYRGNITQVDLGRISARNLMLSHTDLTGLIFARSDLSGSMLEGSDLSGAAFKQATLRDVDFRGANLSKAQFQEADLNGAQLQKADLSGADLSQATGLTAAMLSGAKTDSATKLPAGITAP